MRNEKGDITTNIKDINRIIQKRYKQLSAIEFK